MEATIIYPHQLFEDSPAVCDSRRVYLVEEALLLTHNPIHRQRLMLHKLSMDAYERLLCARGLEVVRLTLAKHQTTAAVFEKIRQDDVVKIHIVDTTDTYLEQAIEQCGLERVWYESPLFILPKAEACERFQKSKRKMANFYKEIRKDKNILLDDNNEPVGGQWSFDEDNRKKIPKGTELPSDISLYGNAETVAAETWVEAVEAEKYGTSGMWLPYTHDGAQEYMQAFFADRFANFGPYEDAITTDGVRLWHSTLSPLINIGLLTPQAVVDAALVYADEHNVPINSLEGFVRQIIGWREFIRASYEVDGSSMRNQNFFSHTRTLPEAFWNGTTDIDPVDHTIKTALTYGYTHHIERLMVAGNFMLLCQTDPYEVYRWFMGMYIDAYDWVMVPNVYGMSQFADGGSFATKPYISGSNYIKKMSDFPKGDWEETWTALYWSFIHTHKEFFKNNHRLSMMPRLLEKMSDEKRDAYLATTKAYVEK